MIWRHLTVAQRAALVIVAVLAALTAGDGLLHAALAQAPFGVPRKAPEPAGGVIGWVLAQQSEFYRAMSAAVRAAKNDGSAVWTLLGIAFAYGIFHAAGPGHGKAVISSYLVANEETARRGIVLSFVSALAQAVVAVFVVGIGAWLLNVTAKAMCDAERVIEIASYGLVAAFGARLIWVKGGGFARALQTARTPRESRLSPATAAATVASGHVQSSHDHAHVHRHEHADEHGHPHQHHHRHDHGNLHHGHAHDHGHLDDEHCGHSHGPEPKDLAGPGGWTRGMSAALAVGLRPCSGAILLLVFALAQGLFWAGVAATFVMAVGTAITVATIAVVAVSAKGVARRLAAGREGGGVLVMRGLEFAAAGLVLLLGLGLLLGYVSAERVTCF